MMDAFSCSHQASARSRAKGRRQFSIHQTVVRPSCFELGDHLGNLGTFGTFRKKPPSKFFASKYGGNTEYPFPGYKGTFVVEEKLLGRRKRGALPPSLVASLSGFRKLDDAKRFPRIHAKFTNHSEAAHCPLPISNSLEASWPGFRSSLVSHPAVRSRTRIVILGPN
jgi:hypothetical protein